MTTITTKTDLSAYVANNTGHLTRTEIAAMAEWFRASEHPAWGTDWEEWLDENWDAAHEAVMSAYDES